MLYLGAASGTTVSHVSDVVGPVSSYLESIFSSFHEVIGCLTIVAAFIFRLV